MENSDKIKDRLEVPSCCCYCFLLQERRASRNGQNNHHTYISPEKRRDDCSNFLAYNRKHSMYLCTYSLSLSLSPHTVWAMSMYSILICNITQNISKNRDFFAQFMFQISDKFSSAVIKLTASISCKGMVWFYSNYSQDDSTHS